MGMVKDIMKSTELFDNDHQPPCHVFFSWQWNRDPWEDPNSAVGHKDIIPSRINTCFPDSSQWIYFSVMILVCSHAICLVGSFILVCHILVLAFVQWHFLALCCTVNAEARRRIRLSIQRQWESWMHWSRRGWQWQWHPGHPHQILPTVSLTNWAFHPSLQTWWAWNLGLFSISCSVSADHVGYCWLWFKKRYYALRSWAS